MRSARRRFGGAARQPPTKRGKCTFSAPPSSLFRCRPAALPTIHVVLLHPMLIVAIRIRALAGAIIQPHRARRRGRASRRNRSNDFVTEVDHASGKRHHRHPAGPIPIPATASTPRVGHHARQPTSPTTSGSSTRWTAPPTSSTVFRSTASASRWRQGAASSRPSSTTRPQRPVPPPRAGAAPT